MMFSLYVIFPCGYEKAGVSAYAEIPQFSNGIETVVLSCGQIYPPKKSFWGILTILFYYKRERERDGEFTMNLGVGFPSHGVIGE
jgi:hypothetical protein